MGSLNHEMVEKWEVMMTASGLKFTPDNVSGSFTVNSVSVNLEGAVIGNSLGGSFSAKYKKDTVRATFVGTIEEK